LFNKAVRFFHLQSWFRLLLLCAIVGLVAGFGALFFERTLNAMQHYVLDGMLFRTEDPNFRYWLVLAVPALGGALAGALALWLAPEATGHGTDAVIRAFHRKQGEIRARVPVVKTICSILTIGSGGSAGKEGPIAQIGAGFGSQLAGLLNLSVRDRRILMLAGVAGGIGAIFKAPLSGALFAAEVLYRDPDFEHDAVIPSVISSVTAYSVFTAIDGHARILELRDIAGRELPSLIFPSVPGGTAPELLHYSILSLLCALTAFLFVKALRFSEDRMFKPLPIPAISKPALGGFLLGALALLMMTLPWQTPSASFHPSQIMSGGHDFLQLAVNNVLQSNVQDYTVTLKMAGFFAIIILAKIVGTAFTIGSGGSGGLLFPAVFLGGLTGATYAKLCRALSDAGWLPQAMALSPSARAGMILVGMGGVFSACTKTPIASLVMVSEITGSYGLVVPLMVTCASAYILSRSFSINEEQVGGIADSPAHRGEFLVNVLEDIRVADALPNPVKPETFHADTPFAAVLERIKHSTATVFPIVDENEGLIGIFSLSDIRQIMNEQSVGMLVVAGDLGTQSVATVSMETNLDEALRQLTSKNVNELPVVEALEARPGQSSAMPAAGGARLKPPRVIAMLSRRDLIAAYQRRLAAFEQADAAEHVGSDVIGEALDAMHSSDELPGVAAEGHGEKASGSDGARL
jgi:chloride channel protein, CIC family